MNYIPEIYISYAWEKQADSTTWSPLVKNLYDTILKTDFSILIDVKTIHYKDSIKEFMQKLGKGNYIIVIISEKYLKSKNCMFEVLEMLRYKDIKDRIFPIISHDASIYDSLKIIEYIKYWDNQIKELNDEAKSLSNVAYAAPIFQDIELMNEIRRIIGSFGEMLRDMNVLTFEKHNNSNFEELLHQINLKVDFDKKNLEVKILNEELIAKNEELEIQNNSLKLENSKLIIGIEELKKKNLEAYRELLKSNDYQYIFNKIKEYEERILSFQNFLGLTRESTKLEVIDLLGTPTEDSETKDDYTFYSIDYENFISIYFHKENNKIMSIAVSDAYKLNKYLDYKSIHDTNLTLIGMTLDKILNYIGTPTRNSSGIISYEREGMTINLTCYEFNENKCSSIEIEYY